jgi:hypothetical protein
LGGFFLKNGSGFTVYLKQAKENDTFFAEIFVEGL